MCLFFGVVSKIASDKNMHAKKMLVSICRFAN